MKRSLGPVSGMEWPWSPISTMKWPWLTNIGYKNTWLTILGRQINERLSFGMKKQSSTNIGRCKIICNKYETKERRWQIICMKRLLSKNFEYEKILIDQYQVWNNLGRPISVRKIPWLTDMGYEKTWSTNFWYESHSCPISCMIKSWSTTIGYQLALNYQFQVGNGCWQLTSGIKGQWRSQIVKAKTMVERYWVEKDHGWRILGIRRPCVRQILRTRRQYSVYMKYEIAVVDQYVVSEDKSEYKTTIDNQHQETSDNVWH